MQSFSLLQMARMGAHAAWGAITRPSLPEFRTHKAEFYPRQACYPVYMRMRDEKKIFFQPRRMSWVIGGDYQTLVHFLRDDRLSLRFADWKFHPQMAQAQKNAMHHLTENLLMNKHRNDHQRLRRLAVTAFSPRIVDKMMPQIRSIVAQHFDELEKSSGDALDFVELARIVPLEILTQYLGVPSDYRKDFFAVSHAVLGQFNPSVEYKESEALEGIEKLKRMVAEKRAHPKDDLVSALATAAEDGDKLSEDEMLALIASVLAAGPDSTRDHINCIAHVFAQFPKAWAEIRANRSLMPNATLEAMRWDGWGHNGYTRFALEDIEIYGITIPKGEMLRFFHPVFLYDESMFERPDEFNIHRPHLDKLLQFGTGPHYCLGANIARAITEAVFDEMLNRYEQIQLQAPPRYESNIISRRMVSLPIRVVKAAAPPAPMATAQA